MTEKRLEDRYDPETDTWSQVEVEVEVEAKEQKGDKKKVPGKEPNADSVAKKSNVITEIDLSWANVFWSCFQFIIAINIIFFPILFIFVFIL